MHKINPDIINNPQIERLLQGIIGITEFVFPNRVQGYYVTGSYADDTAVSASDLDLIIVFKEQITADERNTVWDLSDSTSLLAPIFLDLEGVGEDQVSQKGVQLKLASHCVYGEDIRAQIQLPPIDAYVREWMHDHPLHFMMRVARGLDHVCYPLDFPEPTDMFFGYGKNPIEDKADTKLLVAIAGQIAAALVTQKAKIYVPTKGACLNLYREYINDEWTDFIEQVYKVCRNQWEYQIPEEPNQRKELQNICQRTLDFENHFLAVYQNYLLTELKSKDATAQLKAIKKAGEVIYPAQAVDSILENLKRPEDNVTHKAILEALSKIQVVKDASNLS